jgi:hypothetical protein
MDETIVTTEEPPTVFELRELYRHSRSAANVVRAIVESTPGYFLEWAKLLRAAFDLSLGQVKTIGGWLPDGTGELNDDQLDYFFVPAIESTRSSWDKR